MNLNSVFLKRAWQTGVAICLALTFTALAGCMGAEPRTPWSMSPDNDYTPAGVAETPGEPDQSLPANPDGDIIAEPPDIIDDSGALDLDTEKPEASPEPVARETIPAEKDPVDDEFFADAAFIGNSLVDGFGLYSGLTEGRVFATTSMTVFGVGSMCTIPLDNGTTGTILDAVAQQELGKIYILLGINEIGYSIESFIGAYEDTLDGIIELQPEADIYIMSITPVSAAKSAESDVFNMDRVESFNEELYSLAEKKGIYYLDLCAALAGDDGFLPAEVSSDGIHFKAEHYLVWMDYLRTHYAD